MHPDELRYTKTHEWAGLQDNEVIVGITSHAAEELSDVVYVEMPAAGDGVTQGAPFATLESVKAVAEVYAPVDGAIVAVNERLKDEPGLVNSDPYGEGWIARIQPEEGVTLDGLMDSAAYSRLLIAEQGG